MKHKAKGSNDLFSLGSEILSIKVILMTSLKAWLKETTLFTLHLSLN